MNFIEIFIKFSLSLCMMKKSVNVFFVLILVFGLIFSVSFVSAGWFSDLKDRITGKIIVTCNNIIGDVNNDGKVNTADQTKLMDYLLGKIKLSCSNQADLNSDGKIDVADSVVMTAFLTGKIDKLPAVKCTTVIGDVNNDGKVNTADLVKLNSYPKIKTSSEIVPLVGPENCPSQVDINFNGRIDNWDKHLLEYHFGEKYYGGKSIVDGFCLGLKKEDCIKAVQPVCSGKYNFVSPRTVTCKIYGYGRASLVNDPKCSSMIDGKLDTFSVISLDNKKVFSYIDNERYTILRNNHIITVDLGDYGNCFDGSIILKTRNGRNTHKFVYSITPSNWSDSAYTISQEEYPIIPNSDITISFSEGELVGGRYLTIFFKKKNPLETSNYPYIEIKEILVNARDSTNGDFCEEGSVGKNRYCEDGNSCTFNKCSGSGFAEQGTCILGYNDLGSLCGYDWKGVCDGKGKCIKK